MSIDLEGLKTNVTQLDTLLDCIPSEEEAVIALRQAIVEQLHPIFKEALEITRLTFEIPYRYGAYVLNYLGWRRKDGHGRIQSRDIAENCTEEVIRNSIATGLEQMITAMKKRGEEAKAETERLQKLLGCLAQISKEG